MHAQHIPPWKPPLLSPETKLHDFKHLCVQSYILVYIKQTSKKILCMHIPEQQITVKLCNYVYWRKYGWWSRVAESWFISIHVSEWQQIWQQRILLTQLLPRLMKNGNNICYLIQKDHQFQIESRHKDNLSFFVFDEWPENRRSWMASYEVKCHSLSCDYAAFPIMQIESWRCLSDSMTLKPLLAGTLVPWRASLARQAPWVEFRPKTACCIGSRGKWSWNVDLQHQVLESKK